MLINSWKEWPAGHEFTKNAPKRPHVNSFIIRNTKHHLRTTVETALYIEETSFGISAGRAEINNFHSSAS